MIFNIQRFSTHDGLGIRTVIFYKGCPLRCEWCCNPESQEFGYSLMYDSRLCKNFRDCMQTGNSSIRSAGDGIAINRNAVSKPEKLSDFCVTRALTVSGEEKSNSEILIELKKDLQFYNESGGGVTLSGGEPFSQGPELESLLHELKKLKIDVSIETSLHVSWERIERCLGLIDTFLVDLKHTDIEKFNKYTGGDVSLVLSNLKKLTALDSNIIIRVPVIPEFNHSMEEMYSIIDLSASLNNVTEIHFLPFHNLGNEKYNMLGIENKFKLSKKVDEIEITDYINYAKSLGMIAKTGG